MVVGPFCHPVSEAAVAVVTMSLGPVSVSKASLARAVLQRVCADPCLRESSYCRQQGVIPSVNEVRTQRQVVEFLKQIFPNVFSAKNKGRG